MEVKKYLEIRDNLKSDTMEAIHFLYNLRSNKVLGLEEFRHLFTLWLQGTVGLFSISRINEFTFKELDKHFGF